MVVLVWFCDRDFKRCRNSVSESYQYNIWLSNLRPKAKKSESAKWPRDMCQKMIHFWNASCGSCRFQTYPWFTDERLTINGCIGMVLRRTFTRSVETPSQNHTNTTTGCQIFVRKPRRSLKSANGHEVCARTGPLLARILWSSSISDFSLVFRRRFDNQRLYL